MAEYTGSTVPRGDDKVTEFFTEDNEVPTEPYAVEIEWRDPSGVVLETDTLANGGVYRPTGSTSGNDPGHFKAKRTVGVAEALSAAYTAYGRWKKNSGDAFTSWALIETYEVVASLLTMTSGSPYLCDETDVKDHLVNVNGLTLNDGATSALITRFISTANAECLLEARVATISEFDDRVQLVARRSCALIAAAEVLRATFPQNEEINETADKWRERALERLRAAAMAGNNDELLFKAV